MPCSPEGKKKKEEKKKFVFLSLSCSFLHLADCGNVIIKVIMRKKTVDRIIAKCELGRFHCNSFFNVEIIIEDKYSP
jgi:hypothetical protein